MYIPIIQSFATTASLKWIPLSIKLYYINVGAWSFQYTGKFRNWKPELRNLCCCHWNRFIVILEDFMTNWLGRWIARVYNSLSQFQYSRFLKVWSHQLTLVKMNPFLLSSENPACVCFLSQKNEYFKICVFIYSIFVCENTRFFHYHNFNTTFQSSLSIYITLKLFFKCNFYMVFLKCSTLKWSQCFIFLFNSNWNVVCNQKEFNFGGHASLFICVKSYIQRKHQGLFMHTDIAPGLLYHAQFLSLITAISINLC